MILQPSLNSGVGCLHSVKTVENLKAMLRSHVFSYQYLIFKSNLKFHWCSTVLWGTWLSPTGANITYDIKRAFMCDFSLKHGSSISAAKWSKPTTAAASSFSVFSFFFYHYPSAGQPRAIHRRSLHYIFNQAVMLSQSSVIALQYPWGSRWFLLLWLI